MRTLIGILLISVVAGFGSQLGQAQSGFDVSTGNGLLSGLQACAGIKPDSDPSLTTIAYCSKARGYIEGATAVIFDVRQIQLPAHTTKGQIYDVVEKYLNDHPESRQEYSNHLIERAIAAAWGANK
jgi:hypothetical protein